MLPLLGGAIFFFRKPSPGGHGHCNFLRPSTTYTCNTDHRQRAPSRAPGTPTMSLNTVFRAFRSIPSLTRAFQPARCISQTSTSSAPPPPPPTSAPQPLDKMENLLSNVDAQFRRASLQSIIPGQGSMTNQIIREWEEDDKHKLHVYATKHNTHITLSKPNRDALISVSCGNIGFRKAGRGTYDAGYQLAAFVMNRIQDKGLLPQIRKLELIYRDFGPGREAVTKAILGAEGKKVRPLIVKLSDSTRLKFGGTRSKKPRRLG